MTSRRDFLRHIAVGASGAASLDLFLEARRDLEQTLDRKPPPWKQLRDEYLVDADTTYLNHASIGTVPSVVHQARQRYVTLCETNPWLHMWGGAWDPARESTRELAATELGCQPQEIALTHNTTEGFNLLASGLPLESGDEILFSSLNHPGASECWKHWAKRRGYTVRTFDFPIHDARELSDEAVTDLHLREISDRTRVLVLPHIDNAIGLRTPVRRITQAAREAGVRWVLVDGAQSVGMIPVDVTDLGVDAYATSPHKWLQSPKGLGILFVSPETQAELEAMWVTWGQNRWRGSARIYEDYGTRNLPEVLALGDAIEFQQRLGTDAKEQRLRTLWSRFVERVDRTEGLRLKSPNDFDRGGSVHALEIEGMDSRAVQTTMWREHRVVMRAFHDDHLNTVRVSPNVMNTEDELDRFFDLLARLG